MQIFGVEAAFLTVLFLFLFLFSCSLEVTLTRQFFNAAISIFEEADLVLALVLVLASSF